MTDRLDPHDLAFLDRIAARACDPVAPPPLVRERVLEAVRATPQLDASVPSPEESLTVRAEEGTWKTIAPGARTRRLRKDARQMVFLLELDPNAIVAAHDHAGGEDTYVIRGSCFVGALGLSQGDFHHSNPGTHHGDVVASDEGCLLLITLEAAAA